MVDEYRGRVEKKLELEFGLPMNQGDAANAEGGATIQVKLEP